MIHHRLYLTPRGVFGVHLSLDSKTKISRICFSRKGVVFGVFLFNGSKEQTMFIDFSHINRLLSGYMFPTSRNQKSSEVSEHVKKPCSSRIPALLDPRLFSRTALVLRMFLWVSHGLLRRRRISVAQACAGGMRAPVIFSAQCFIDARDGPQWTCIACAPFIRYR